MKKSKYGQNFLKIHISLTHLCPHSVLSQVCRGTFDVCSASFGLQVKRHMLLKNNVLQKGQHTQNLEEKNQREKGGRHVWPTKAGHPTLMPDVSISHLHDRHHQSMSAIYRPNIPPFLLEFWPLIRMPCSSCFHANHSSTRACHFKYILKTGTLVPIFRLQRPTLYLYWCRMIEEEAKDKTSRQ